MRSFCSHAARLTALSAAWIAALAVAMLIIAPRVSEPTAYAEPARTSYTLPNGLVVPDLWLELPESDTVPQVPEDAEAFDCRVDGNQICGTGATVLGPFDSRTPVAAGYYGQHCYAEPFNPGARDALGMPALDFCE